MNTENKKDWKKFKDEQVNTEQQEALFEKPILDEEDDEQEAEASSALEHLSYQELEEKLTLAEQNAHENWEKSVRAIAELENVRRRAERDVTNAHRYSLEKFVNSLLSVLDSLEQAIQLAEEHLDASMREGLELTRKLFLDVLAKYEVQQLNPKDELFDPQQHEAMSMQEIPGVAPNTVVTVCQKGYKLYDRVIRPARVIVAK